MLDYPVEYTSVTPPPPLTFRSNPHSLWVDVLDHPYRLNPNVLLVLAPADWKGCIVEMPNQLHLGILETPSGQRGLQVLNPKIALYEEHVRVFERYHIPMMGIAYTGRLDGIPDRCLMDTDLVPLVFLRDAMWRRPLNLRTVWTKAEKPC